MQRALLLVMLTFGLASTAHAIPLTWTINNLVYDDGGTATGSFVYDADTNGFSNIVITTSAGTTRAGQTYGVVSPGVTSATLADFLDMPLPILNGVTQRMNMFLAAAMTNAGGTIFLRQADEFTCLSGGCTLVSGGVPNELRRYRGNTAFITTEPSATLLEPHAGILLALGLMGMLTQRRRKAA